jgi:hypothetical protein
MGTGTPNILPNGIQAKSIIPIDAGTFPRRHAARFFSQSKPSPRETPKKTCVNERCMSRYARAPRLWQSRFVSVPLTFGLVLVVRTCDASTSANVDCTVSQWSAWSPPCPTLYGSSGRCTAPAKQMRKRGLLRVPQGKGKPCPKFLRQFQQCGHTPCAGKGPSVLCGGVAWHGDGKVVGVGSGERDGESSGVMLGAGEKWQSFGDRGIYMVVDTSR